jgi:CubicO group peptidase (beta-lactamase class C family)
LPRDVSWSRVLWAGVFSIGLSALSVHAQTWLPQYDLSPQDYQDNFATLVPQGYRPVSITAHANINGPRYQVIWVRDGFANWAAAEGLTYSQYQSFAATQTSLARRPICLDTYGSFPNERYVTIWISDGGYVWTSQTRMTPSTFQNQHATLVDQGYRLIWVSADGELPDTLFHAIWIVDLPGNCVEQALFSKDPFEFWLTYTHIAGCRLISASGYNSPENPLFAAAWVYWEQPPWTSFYNQTFSELQSTSAQYLAMGFKPTFVTGYETTDGTRYVSAWERQPRNQYWNVRGPASPEMADLDERMRNFMIDRHIPNGALAVTKDSRLVYAKGFTHAEEGWFITRPETPFRLASNSKPLTAVGIMKLIDDGIIGIDQPINTLMNTSNWIDPRINDVTIRHLLQHRGGWDINALGFEPLLYDFEISMILNQPLPTTPQMIIDYMATQPMQFDPGTDAVYCNFGYVLLGRIIELVTGQSYETFVRDNVFGPLEVYGPRVTSSAPNNQLLGEPPYVDPYQRIAYSVFGEPSPTLVPLPYGGWNLSTMSGASAWATSVVDYARFLTAFDDPSNSPLLSEATIDLMWSPPPGALPDYYYAAGWIISVDGQGGIRAGHSGTFNGTTTLFARRPDGINWVVHFNTSQVPGTGSIIDIVSEVDDYIDQFKDWPTYDHFPWFDRGDMDCDGQARIEDVNGFVLSLTNPAAYQSLYPACNAARADMNGDGRVDGLDIGLFVDRLLAGQ